MTDDVDVDVLFWRRAGTAGKGKLTSGLYYGTRLVINYEVRLLYAALPRERQPVAPSVLPASALSAGPLLPRSACCSTLLASLGHTACLPFWQIA